MNFFIKAFGFCLIIGVFIGYLFFQLRSDNRRPEIKIVQPEGSIFFRSQLKLHGRTRNLLSLEINGRPSLLNSSGEFSEDLLLSSGLNIVEIKGKDKFGRYFIKDTMFEIK